MKKAVIDCGSNSFRLLIVDTIEGKVKELFREFRMVQLGASLEALGGIIDQATEQRCLTALSYFKSKIDDYKCEEIICLGTSALRSAVNAQQFCQTVMDELGLQIDIIDGQTEAWYSFCGANGSSQYQNGTAVLDIGGGSTEIAISSKASLWSCSIPAGAVRLTNAFLKDKDNKPSIVDLKALSDYVCACWTKYIGDCPYPIKRLIGVAGTITTLAAIKNKLNIYDSQKINNTVLYYNEIEEILTNILDLDIKERYNVVGMYPPKRAEIIVAGIIILLSTLKVWGQNQLIVKDSCLLQGALLAQKNNKYTKS